MRSFQCIVSDLQNVTCFQRRRGGVQSDCFKDTVLKNLCSLGPLRQCFYLGGVVCHAFMTWQKELP